MKAALLSLSLLGILGCVSTQDERNRPESPNSTPSQIEAPFARVSLALRGCSSCSHCRSSIRQMTKSAAGDGQIQIGRDEVEVTYATPQTVPLRETIERLANSGLHDMSVLDVLFDAEGSLEKTEDGKLVFSLSNTHQKFPFRVSEFQEMPPLGKTLRVRSVVQGWEKSSDLSLNLKYVL